MSRLRPLTEAECYTRLYGDRESAVTVLRDGEPVEHANEHLQRLFEELAEEDELPAAEAA